MKIRFLLLLSIVSFCIFSLIFYFNNDRISSNSPPMGWNGWNRFKCDNASEKLIIEMTDAMVDSGMKKSGYQYIVIDDCWQSGRDEYGNIVVDQNRFPHGMKYVSDYIHDKGLKFGIYTSAGTETCERRPGSFGHEQQDLNTYISWGVDYIKLDWCYTAYLYQKPQYQIWQKILEESGESIFLSISEFGTERPWRWNPQMGNSWRITHDVEDNWKSIKRLINWNKLIVQYSRENGWNDMDMLQIGNGNMNIEEYKTHFSMWAMMGSPLMAGNDLRAMNEDYRKILTNRDVIAVNQDMTSSSPELIENNPDYQIWFKKLKGSGRKAVVLLNMSENEQSLNINFSDLNFFRVAYVKDLWNKNNQNMYLDKYEVKVPPHGIAMLEVKGLEIDGKEIKPKEPSVVKTGYLADQQWVYGANVLDNKRETHNKDLNVQAVSDIKYNLSKKCSFFEAEIGINDFVVDPNAQVFFQVFADGSKIYDSYIVKTGDELKQIKLDILGKEELILHVYSAPLHELENRYAKWANVRVVCE